VWINGMICGEVVVCYGMVHEGAGGERMGPLKLRGYGAAKTQLQDANLAPRTQSCAPSPRLT
jgi:hypothetical protein